MRGAADPDMGELLAQECIPPDTTVSEQHAQACTMRPTATGAPSSIDELGDLQLPRFAGTEDEQQPPPKLPHTLHDSSTVCTGKPLSVGSSSQLQPQVRPGAKEATPIQPTSVVQPQEMYSAVVDARKAAPHEPPRDAWMTTVAELFAIVHDTVVVDAELVPLGKKRFPKLHNEEKKVLFRFFEEACVACDASYEAWVAQAKKVTHSLYNTNWSFTPILQNMISKVKWAKLTPLNPWTTSTAPTSGSVEGANGNNGERETYKPFLFNPAVYNAKDIKILRAICLQPAVFNSRSRLREGTQDEWRIISGLAEGSIVCRRLPIFLTNVLDSKERVRLYRTIQAQVEGELVLRLRSGLNIRMCRQNTSAIKEDILLAAERLRVNQDELRRLLNVAKTISYNQVERSIHFYFFDRATARDLESIEIPFRSAVYRMVNVHQPAQGSVWARQNGRDGPGFAAAREYTVELHNVTRFTDIGKLTAYFQAHIAADFELEDLDICTPNSRTSTVWRLTVKLAGCPDFLRGVVRVIWFGRPIVLKHPEVGRRLQCLACGELGHTMARCRFTEDQMCGPGSRVATDREIAALQDLATPFHSLDEIKETAARRLNLQHGKDKRAQEAVAPSATDASTSDAPTNQASCPSGAQPPVSAPQTEPSPKKRWVTVPLRRRRHQLARSRDRLARPPTVASFYADLENWPEDTSEAVDPPSIKPKGLGAVELSSGDDEEKRPSVTITEEAKKQLYLRATTPPKRPPTSQLLTRTQQERATLRQAVAEVLPSLGSIIPPKVMDLATEPDLPTIEQDLGLTPVTTPATGNCMAMALAQAVSDHDLVADDGSLEFITACIKRGIHWAALLHFEEQFSHSVRTATLVNVHRGWDGMTPRESAKQFQWYLHEYATSPSARISIIERHTWGGSEILSIAANFLRRKVFVLGCNTDGKQSWACSLFRPSTNTRGSKLYETGQQIPLDIRQCVKAISLAKTQDHQQPLVLRFWGDHYSAYVHARAPENKVHSKISSLPTRSTQRDQHSDMVGTQQLVHTQHATAACPTPVSQRHTDDNSATNQLALIPSSREITDHPVAQKRAHSTTPAEGEQIRQVLRTRDALHEHDGDAVMSDVSTQLVIRDPANTRDSWTELWKKHGEAWPDSAAAVYPQVHSSPDEWITVAQREPKLLLLMVQRFPYPAEVLNALAVQVFESWTAAWRRGCLQVRIGAYRSRTTDPSTKKWLESWCTKFTRPSPYNLPALTDSRDDWVRLRTNAYGDDPVLKLCDVTNKARFAKHIICAGLYEHEIRVLLGQEDRTAKGTLHSLGRHSAALKSITTYREAFNALMATDNWDSVASFFANAFEHGSIEAGPSY